MYKVVAICFYLVDCILGLERFEFISDLIPLWNIARITFKSKCSSQLCECTLLSSFRVRRLSVYFINTVVLYKRLFLDFLLWLVKLSNDLFAHLEVLLHPVVSQLTLLLKRLFSILR